MSDDNKKFWYSLKLRRISQGTQPDGFIGFDKTKTKWGAVAYDRRLTREEIDHYDLVPLEEKIEKSISPTSVNKVAIPENDKPKYRFVSSDGKRYENRKLYRIQALKDFGEVKAGDLGGYIESEQNLPHDNSAWVFDKAMVFGSSKVLGDSHIHDYAIVKNSNIVNTVVKGKSILINSYVKESVSADYSYVENAIIDNCSLSDRALVTGDRNKAQLIACRLSSDVSIDGPVHIKNSVLENRVCIEGETKLENVYWDDNRKIVNQEAVCSVKNKSSKKKEREI